MSSAQDRTLAQYQGMMQVNASSHLLRTARSTGITGELRKGQRTLDQLIEALHLDAEPLKLLIDALLAIGIVEKYGDDHALSRAGHLLCQYDEDLGDAIWAGLAGRVNGKRPRDEADDQLHHHHLAATEWIHTPSAMQAAEILDIGGATGKTGIQILDLGCGSAVWSCAMAHRDAKSTLTVVDGPAAIESAQSTAESIELTKRLTTIVADPMDVDIEPESYDLVLLAQRISALGNDQASSLIAKAATATASGGRVVVIDLFRGPTQPNLAESIEALKLEVGTRAGHMRTLEQIQQDLSSVGLAEVQFTFLAASRIPLGLAVGVKS